MEVTPFLSRETERADYSIGRVKVKVDDTASGKQQKSKTLSLTS